MQITITQIEIEAAIIDYIKSQITVKDNMAITVDLRATRGAEGNTAIIDISPATPVVSTEPVKRVVTQTAVSAQPIKTEKAEPSAWPIPEAEPEIPVVAEAEPEVPVTAGKSLFGGMKKPVNTPAESA